MRCSQKEKAFKYAIKVNFIQTAGLENYVIDIPT